ncbi:MAG: LPS-assembly protein LptD [Deltaproteobacteria bacterium]|nr:LPS-assembly protein LptD [Deltaproteobacteria bacterium]
MRPLIIFLLSALLFAAMPGVAMPEEFKGELFKTTSPVDITADSLSYDQAAQTYHAIGNVVIVQDTVMLTTEEIILDMAAGVATARGNVEIVDEGGNTLRGERLTFNVRDKTAVLARGRLFYQRDNVYITGDPIEKTGPQSYAGRKITYTTCDCEEGKSPAWSFRTTSAKITVGDFLTGWNARFYIKGVPILYAPYLSVPVKRERQSGFLQPRPGYSRLRGFVLDNSFFWAISRNMDATFYLDAETSRGTGAGTEYRYIRTRKSFGEMFAYYYHEKDIDRVREFRQGVDNLSRPENAGSNRWRLKLNHTELFDTGLKFRANIDFVSDDEFFIDFGKSSQEKSLESIESNISLSKSWSAYSLVAQFRLFNNLLTKDDTATLQKLPEVTLTGSDKKIFNTPFYLSSESSLVNFVRKTGPEGQRLDVHPRVSLPLSPGGYFDLTPSFAPRATYYLVKDHPQGDFKDRYLYDIKVDLTTTFVKIYKPEIDSLKGVMHTIRPRLTYTYIPEAVQSDLPSFDSVDNIQPANSITYSLNSILTGKTVEGASKRYFNFFYLDISQTYNIREATRRLSTAADKRKPFSDIAAELIVRPSELLTFSAKGKYDVYESRFNSYDASLNWLDRRGDTFNAAYRFVRGGANYLEASARARLMEPLDLTYLKRFSFDEYRSLETTYGTEYRHQCWTMALTYTERLEEKIIYLTFNLRGLGKVAGIKGRIEPQ